MLPDLSRLVHGGVACPAEPRLRRAERRGEASRLGLAPGRDASRVLTGSAMDTTRAPPIGLCLGTRTAVRERILLWRQEALVPRSEPRSGPELQLTYVVTVSEESAPRTYERLTNGDNDPDYEGAALRLDPPVGPSLFENGVDENEYSLPPRDSLLGRFRNLVSQVAESFETASAPGSARARTAGEYLVHKGASVHVDIQTTTTAARGKGAETKNLEVSFVLAVPVDPAREHAIYTWLRTHFHRRLSDRLFWDRSIRKETGRFQYSATSEQWEDPGMAPVHVLLTYYGVELQLYDATDPLGRTDPFAAGSGGSGGSFEDTAPWIFELFPFTDERRQRMSELDGTWNEVYVLATAVGKLDHRLFQRSRGECHALRRAPGLPEPPGLPMDEGP